MKRILSIVCLALLIPILLSAQTPFQIWAQKQLPPEIHETIDKKDKNHEYEYIDDYGFNDKEWWYKCYSIDGEYIGPNPIGIDRYAVETIDSVTHGKSADVPFMVRGIGPKRDSMWVDMNLEKKKYKIAGHKIWYIQNFRSLKGKVKLLTLDEVRQKYAPKVKGPVVYMINKFFIMQDVELYKIDKDFIFEVQMVNSKDIEALKKMKKFTIIRIYTRTHHNWHQNFIG